MAGEGVRKRLLMVALLLAACRSGEHDPERQLHPDSVRAWDSAMGLSVRPPDSAKAWSVRPTKNYLSCSPQNVGPNDALILRMERPHGSSLHVGGPDGTPFIVVFHGEGQPDRAARRSLMRPEAFEQLTELRLLVKSATAGVWIFGRDTNEVLFRTPGVYRIRVGNDMETDGPDYAECVVTYRPQ
jgi:hypothetical protein